MVPIDVPMVPKVGFEPTRLSTHDFESCTSTNSVTRANTRWFHKAWGAPLLFQGVPDTR